MSDSITQEFYCGECSGYFLVRLNINLNMEVMVRCPKCNHLHQRCITDGQIFEKGRFQTKVKENIRTTMASYSKKPHTEEMQKAHKKNKHDPYCSDRRDGVPMSPAMMDRWLNVAAREKGED